MVWRYDGEGAIHKMLPGSMEWFLRNLDLRTDDERRTDGATDDARLCHDSSSADKIKQS